MWTQARPSHSRPARNPQRISSIDSTLSADRRDLLSVIVWPTAEKSRSDCAELAEMQNTRRATCDRTGKSFWFCLQKSSGLSQAPGTCIPLYCASSSRPENMTGPLGWWPVEDDAPSLRLAKGSIRAFFAAGGSGSRSCASLNLHQTCTNIQFQTGATASELIFTIVKL